MRLRRWLRFKHKTRVFLEDVRPRLQALAREIAIDPPDARLTELGDLLKKSGGDTWRRVVSINEDRKSARAAFFRHVWTSAVRARAVLERVSCYEEEANASRFGFREDAQ